MYLAADIAILCVLYCPLLILLYIKKSGMIQKLK